MKSTHDFARLRRNVRAVARRTLSFEPLQARELFAADTFIGPRPPVKDRPVISYEDVDLKIADDLKRAFGSIAGKSEEVAKSAMPKLPTDVVGAEQKGIPNAQGATDVVNGGQDAARMGAATEVVDGGQAAKIGGAATEVVNGGQDAWKAAAGPWDHLPRIIHTPEWNAVFDAHLAAVNAGDTSEAIRTANQLPGLEVLEFPDGSQVHTLTGEPYVPASQVDEVVDAAADAGSAGGRVAGKVLGAIGTAADFLVDPILGTVFYDDNLETGEQVFGEDSYASEVYANMQCVPLLGGPTADVAACLCTIFKTDWGTVLFGPDHVPTPDEAQAAIDRYRDLENRKDYDANHGNLYQEALWEAVLAAKAELEAMGINPAAVR